MRLLVLNGPNLNLLGIREPDVYGSTTLSDLDEMVSGWAEAIGVDIHCLQSNDEAKLIGEIHDFDGDGIIINPGALTHTSHAIADAIRGVETPTVEVHISNVKEREPWRARSLVADACVHTIFGRGVRGYRAAIHHLFYRAAVPFETISYGPDRDQVGDLRGEGADLVVLVHGGLWQQKFARDTMDGVAVDLARRGYRSWNLEFRRLGGGGGWPASGHDVLTALDFVPQLGFEPARVMVVSHSAGSQLAMWAAERSLTKVELHVAMAPLVDLAAAVENGDTGADECGRMLEGGASPSIRPDRITTVVTHGDADQIVPWDRSEKLAEEGHELRRFEGDHFGLLDPATEEWAWVANRIGTDS
jgi:3-dehydroquinate dehydratase-2